MIKNCNVAKVPRGPDSPVPLDRSTRSESAGPRNAWDQIYMRPALSADADLRADTLAGRHPRWSGRPFRLPRSRWSPLVPTTSEKAYRRERKEVDARTTGLPDRKVHLLVPKRTTRRITSTTAAMLEKRATSHATMPISMIDGLGSVRFASCIPDPAGIEEMEGLHISYTLLSSLHLSG